MVRCVTGIDHAIANAGGKAAAPGARWDGSPLEDVLQRIYTDSWVAGTRIAADQADKGVAGAGDLPQMAAGIDWSTWKPGDTDAAMKAADGGLRQLLDDASSTVKGIGDTTIDRIGNAIADGLAAGDPINTVASNITDFLGDPARSFLIAQTETSRAMIAAQSDQYQALGFATFDWLSYDGACQACQDQEDANPHNFSDEQPPGHPSCRCSIVGSGDVDSSQAVADSEYGPGDSPSGATPPSDAPDNLEHLDTSGGSSLAPTLNAPARTFDYFAQNWSTVFNAVSDDPYWDGIRGNGDKAMQEIWRLNGFDAKPTVINDEQFAKLADNGWQPMYRGIAANTADQVQEYVDAFKTGDAFAGQGMFGNGTYASKSVETADEFTKQNAKGEEIEFGQRMDLLMHPDAKIINQVDLRAEFLTYIQNLRDEQSAIKEEYPTLPNESQREWLDRIPKEVRDRYDTANDGRQIIEDPMRYASAAGYDCVFIENPMVNFSSGATVDDTYYVILNRGAIAVRA